MKTGVILEVQNGRAVILDGSGAFRDAAARPEWRCGDVVPLPGARRRMGWAAGLAACLVLTLAGSGGWLWLRPAALVSMDVNPSVELTLNRFDRVLDARAMNDEGAALLDAGGVKGMEAGAAVAALLGSDYLDPYLERENYVALTVQSENAALEEKLLTLVGETAASTVPPATSVSCHRVDSALVEAAHGCGVTAGKYLALLELQDADPAIDITEYAHCGLGEIADQTARCHAAGDAAAGAEPGGTGTGPGCGMGHGHWYGHE